MSEYLKKGGLINGLIPAGTSCPYLERCKFKVHTCPGVDDKMKANHFSCAAARLHSAIAQSDDAPNFQAMAKEIVEEKPILFELYKKPIHITFTGMKAVKPEDEK